MSAIEQHPARDEGPVVIAAIGLATAQGSAADLLAGAALAPPGPLPWPADRWTTSGLCRPARGLDPGLAGAGRWRALARRALAECCGDSLPADGTPLVVASCNGMAPSFEAEAWRSAFDTTGLLDLAPWAGVRPPVASAACASGLQGLFLARLLLEGGAGEVVLLAVDILSAPAHANFEALRVLAPELQTPWQPATEGFLFGEAAVALRLRRGGSRGGPGPRLRGPALSQDLNGGDGLERALDALPVPGGGPFDLILGQGTGPSEVDRAELAAVRRAVPDLGVPLTSPLFHFGHTLGSSGVLSLALAALRGPRPAACPALALPEPRASDGRALLGHSGADRSGPEARSLVVCRALGGACAAAALDDSAASQAPPGPPGWAAPVPPGPIHHPLLRRLASEAPRHRPGEPPDLLVVHLDEPLTPPPRALVGGRLLPSAVLEITPGRAALQVAQGWGYQGPALCLVGGPDASWRAAIQSSGRRVIVVTIHPGHENVEWS